MPTPNRPVYPTDVSEAEWSLWENFIPKHRSHPNFPSPKYLPREIFCAILYRERTGCQWRNLPHDFPPWRDVYYHFAKWRDTNVFGRARDALRRRIRQEEGRNAEPSLGIVDSQSVKGTELTAESGFDGGKKVKGRKRHLLVDVLGLVLAVAVTSASVQDRDGFVKVVDTPRWNWPLMTKILVDGAYNGEVIQKFEQEHEIQVDITKTPPGQKGFVVVAKRWVVERTHGWFNWERVLSKCFERLAKTEEADINMAASQMMVKRLAGNITRWRKPIDGLPAVS
jgi:transposase